jgi:hypothetical protein
MTTVAPCSNGMTAAAPQQRDDGGFSIRRHNDNGSPIRWHDYDSSSIRKRCDSGSLIWRRGVDGFLEACTRHRFLEGAHSGVEHAGIPPPSTTPAFHRRERRRRTSLGASGGGSVTLFLCYFVYIFMPTSIGFYYTLSVHGSPSIFCMFMIFLFTFYVYLC